MSQSQARRLSGCMGHPIGRTSKLSSPTASGSRNDIVASPYCESRLVSDHWHHDCLVRSLAMSESRQDKKDAFRSPRRSIMIFIPESSASANFSFQNIRSKSNDTASCIFFRRRVWSCWFSRRSSSPFPHHKVMTNAYLLFIHRRVGRYSRRQHRGSCSDVSTLTPRPSTFLTDSIDSHSTNTLPFFFFYFRVLSKLETFSIVKDSRIQ